ncbi:MAG: Xaa-Pro peptidase family protein [Legionella sp.]|nr:Xaa-Pro peptidase family protein [Legionella sp.]
MTEKSKTPPDSKTVNIERLHALMDRDELAAVVVRGGANVSYLASIAYHGTLARHLDLGGSPRGIVVVWPRDAQPVIVVDVTAGGATRRDSWIRDVEVYDGYGESLFDRVGSVIERLGLGKSRVGFDRNFIGAGYWAELQQRLPNLEMHDATNTLDEVRWIKTTAEIDRFRAGARLLDKVFASVLPTVRSGESETQVHGRIIGGCLSEGAEFAHGILNSHRNPIIYCGESDFVFERGDIVRTDYLAYLRGYPGHQSRNAVIGKPSDNQRSDYARYYEIYQATADRLRPGVTSGDLYQFVVDRFAKVGWNYTAGLVGHSVGPWWHQQNPIFCRGNNVPLQEGMVVALEPFLDHWHCQDLFLITGDTPELLSPDFDTSEMFVIE